MALINYHNEYSQLKKVALYRPTIDEIDQRDPTLSMYIDRPDPKRVLQEFDAIVAKLKDLGIEVIVLQGSATAVKTSNMIFLRDVAFAFRDKLLLANMKYPIRQEEPKKFKNLLTAYDKQFEDVFIQPEEDVSMEGADIIVINDELLYAYTGSRTSHRIASSLSQNFANARTETIEANIYGVPQHILGGVHILDDKAATRRVSYCKDNIEGYSFVDFEEDEEITKGFALNIVTLSPREILMPSGNPVTLKKLEANGVICHEVPVHEIHKMGGGLACMVLPLYRK